MANHKKKDILEKLTQYPLSKRIYLDQSGINKAVGRHYGYSLRGKPVYGKKSGKRYARENFTAALRGKEIIAPFCYSGSCNTRLFNAWLKQYLLPSLSPNHVLIMDNAAFHKSKKTMHLIKKAKCHLLFLPPYSPELNPIEKFLAHLKRTIKNHIHAFKSLQSVIDFAFKMY